MILVLVLLLLLGGFAMMGFGGFGMMGGYGMMRGFYSPLGLILTLIFWALVIAAVVFFVLWLVRSAGGGAVTLSHPHEAPLDILKVRYARGEISKEQFDEMRRDLGT